MTDRTVHAEHPEHGQIVRYDRAGKWYIEPNPPLTRTHIDVQDAAGIAARWVAEGGRVFLERQGGKTFERLVRRMRGAS